MNRQEQAAQILKHYFAQIYTKATGEPFPSDGYAEIEAAVDLIFKEIEESHVYLENRIDRVFRTMMEIP